MFITTSIFTAAQAMGQSADSNEFTGMRAGGKIYVVIAVLAIIWIGFGVLLFSMDRRLKSLEKEKAGK